MGTLADPVVPARMARVITVPWNQYGYAERNSMAMALVLVQSMEIIQETAGQLRTALLDTLTPGEDPEVVMVRVTASTQLQEAYAMAYTRIGELHGTEAYLPDPATLLSLEEWGLQHRLYWNWVTPTEDEHTDRTLVSMDRGRDLFLGTQVVAIVLDWVRDTTDPTLPSIGMLVEILKILDKVCVGFENDHYCPAPVGYQLTAPDSIRRALTAPGAMKLMEARLKVPIHDDDEDAAWLAQAFGMAITWTADPPDTTAPAMSMTLTIASID